VQLIAVNGKLIVPPALIGDRYFRSATSGFVVNFLGAGVEIPKMFRSNDASTPIRHVIGPTSPRDQTQSSEVDHIDGSSERPRVDAVSDGVEVENDSTDVERGECGGRQVTDVLAGEVEGPEGLTGRVRRVHVYLGHGDQPAALDLIQDRALAVALPAGVGGDRPDWTDWDRFGR